MAWPNARDFTDAMQNPALCFRGNPELQGADVAVYGPDRGARAGRPEIYSGQFACVYRVTSAAGQPLAVRCFTREVSDQQRRYEALNGALTAIMPPNLVMFEYLNRGILVRGEWYPIVKMDWANGAPLDHYVRDNLDRTWTIELLARRWRGLVTSLRAFGIAHNDLQHGNVMVNNDALKLVDYDGLYLPAFRGEPSPELGHKNYQHPQRTANHYDEHTDNFSSLVVYVSLLALSSDPGLWQFYNQDNLILTRDDFVDPVNSSCFMALKNNPDPQVRELAIRLQEYCSLPPDRMPTLEDAITGGGGTPPAPRPTATPGQQPGRQPGSGQPRSFREELLNRSQQPAPPNQPANPRPAPAPASQPPPRRRRQTTAAGAATAAPNPVQSPTPEPALGLPNWLLRGEDRTAGYPARTTRVAASAPYQVFQVRQNERARHPLLHQPGMHRNAGFVQLLHPLRWRMPPGSCLLPPLRYQALTGDLVNAVGRRPNC